MSLSLEDIEDIKRQFDNFERVLDIICNTDYFRYSSPYKKKKMRKKKSKVYYKKKKKKK